MNIALWVAQGLLGLGFLGAGYNHGFQAEQMKSQRGGEWVAAVPKRLLDPIAACEILGGIAVILPALTGILPWLTPVAATLFVLLMLLAAGFHLLRREFPNIVFNVILLALAAFVAYGRFVIVPL
ncbi:MAG: DoxX family protein [Anaerolineales bacterium]